MVDDRESGEEKSFKVTHRRKLFKRAPWTLFCLKTSSPKMEICSEQSSKPSSSLRQILFSSKALSMFALIVATGFNAPTVKQVLADERRETSMTARLPSNGSTKSACPP